MRGYEKGKGIQPLKVTAGTERTRLCPIFRRPRTKLKESYRTVMNDRERREKNERYEGFEVKAVVVI